MITSRDVLGFSVAPNMGRIMEANGYYASIMRAEKAAKDNSGLPLGIPIPVMPVDYLKSRPNFWIGGQGSYVCPIESDWALWFNWQMNINNISILTSVKGMNPITGQRIAGYELEQYKNKCPIHDIEFKHGKFCPECNFKWPDQNYITDPNPYFLDGFRAADGTVHQFYFTEDMAKSIPELVIGKEDTIPGFGFCFYSLKNSKNDYEGGNRIKNKFPKEAHVSRMMLRSSDVMYRSGRSGCSSRGAGMSVMDLPIGSGLDMNSERSCYYSASSEPVRGAGFGDEIKLMSSGPVPVGATPSEMKTSGGPISAMNFCSTDSLGSIGAGTLTPTSGIIIPDSSKSHESIKSKSVRRKSTAEVGIGAGAKIQQNFEGDNRSVTDWNDKPAGVIRLYFVFREQFEKYVADGLNDLTGTKQGFLDALPVGSSK
jgi:hypothetical protein